MFTPENLAAVVLLLALILYAVFGGADFGGGIWTALARGRRAHEQRESLFHAIGPVWETNHIWLIFVIVTLFTVFPRGFAVLFIALLVPFVIALIGINFRGAAFAFRHFGRETRWGLPATGQVFSMFSILTPLTMGMAVTAVAAGRIGVHGGEVEAGAWSCWITPFTIGGGIIGLAVCAFLTPIYMAVRTHGNLQEDFRRQALSATVALGILTALEVPIAWFDAPLFARRLFHPLPLTFVGLAVVCGLATLLTLMRRRYRFAQVLGAGAVAMTLTGFAATIFPDLILGELTLAEAAAPRETIRAYLGVLPVGALILIPSLWLLYWTFRGEPDPERPAEGGASDHQ